MKSDLVEKEKRKSEYCLKIGHKKDKCWKLYGKLARGVVEEVDQANLANLSDHQNIGTSENTDGNRLSMGEI